MHQFLLFYSDYEAGARQIDGVFFGHLKQPVRGEMLQQLHCPLCLKVFALRLEHTDLWPLSSVQCQVVEEKKSTFRSWKCQCERCVQPISYIKLKCPSCKTQSCLNSILLSFKASSWVCVNHWGNLGIQSDAPSLSSCVPVTMWAHHSLQFGFARLAELWTRFKGSYYR